ncbi:MAG: hypothetical protein HYX44_02880 [Aquabacterium sp.]|nr:hypothetical protein [Aquabacterium sp.]
MPKWTAGLPLSGMGSAVALSTLAHALALAWWLHARHNEAGTFSVSQKRGGLTVTIAPATEPARTKSPHVEPKAATQKPTKPRVPARHSLPPAPTQAAAPSLPPPEAPSPAPTQLPATDTPAPADPQPLMSSRPATTTQAEAPGARFANLFAPIVSRPLGRGGWQARPTAIEANPATAAMQREQAIQGTRQALAQRMEAMRPWLREAPLQGRCEVRIALAQHAAQLNCTEAADLQRLSPQFASLLSLQPAAASLAADACLLIQASEMGWQDCPAPAGLVEVDNKPLASP